MRKRVLALLMCGVLMMFSLTGCSGDDSDNSASTSESVAAEASTVAAESDSTEEVSAAEETEAEEAAEAASVAESVAATEESDAEASEEMCSDADYKSLQDAYTSVSQQYEMVQEYYQANFEADEDMDEFLATVKEGLDLFSSKEQSDLSADDALTLAEMLSGFATQLDDTAKTLVAAREADTQ